MNSHSYLLFLLLVSIIFSTTLTAFADNATTIPWKITIKKTTDINGTSFLPSEIHAKQNDTILWINNDTASHTVTSGVLNHPTYTGKIFDSDIIAPGGTYSFKVSSNEWSAYYYFCKIHPWMTGKIDTGIAYLLVSPDFNISTDKTSYSENDTIRVAGIVNDTLQVMPLTIQIFDSQRNLVYLDKTNLFKDYSFLYELEASSSIFKTAGNYKIKSMYGFPATITDIDISYTGPKASHTEKVNSFHYPHWLKNNARWWSDSKIDDREFINEIQFLMQKKYITIPISDSPKIDSYVIPIWIKNNAGSWAKDSISDEEFNAGIEYMIIHGIVQV